MSPPATCLWLPHSSVRLLVDWVAPVRGPHATVGISVALPQFEGMMTAPPGNKTAQAFDITSCQMTFSVLWVLHTRSTLSHSKDPCFIFVSTIPSSHNSCTKSEINYAWIYCGHQSSLSHIKGRFVSNMLSLAPLDRWSNVPGGKFKFPEPFHAWHSNLTPVLPFSTLKRKTQAHRFYTSLSFCAIFSCHPVNCLYYKAETVRVCVNPVFIYTTQHLGLASLVYEGSRS